MKALAVAAVDLRRLVRWRANLFFLLVLPLLLILLLGAAFGGSEARLGAVAGDGPLAAELVRALDREQNLVVERYGDEARLERAVQRGQVQAGLVVPAAYDRVLEAGGTARLRFFARPDSLAGQLRLAVDAAVADTAGVVRAARLLGQRRGSSFEDGLRQARDTASDVPRVAVRLTEPDGSAYPEAAGRFEGSASTQLLLFVFLTSLTGAGALIEARRLGVVRRMLATPTPLRTILAGAGLGRFSVAAVQALLIMVGSTVAFGVGWGDPLAAVVLVLAFCVVGAGAGLLVGSTLANEQQSAAVGLLLGLGLAAIGGSMVPLEVFPDALRTAAHLTPHAWGNDAFSELLDGGGLADVLVELGVLLGFAAVLLALATWRLRRTLTS